MKLDPDIYLKAAEMVASVSHWDHGPACRAIMLTKYGWNWSGGHWNRCRERRAFEQLFKPYGEDTRNPAYWFNQGSASSNQNDRVLALLFMHQIAKNT